jgi:hypothetical protein
VNQLLKNDFTREFTHELCKIYDAKPPKPRNKSIIFNIKSILEADNYNISSLTNRAIDKVRLIQAKLREVQKDGLVESLRFSLEKIR